MAKRSVIKKDVIKNKYQINLSFPNGDNLKLTGSTKLDAKGMIQSNRTLKAIYKQYGLFSAEAIEVFNRALNFDLVSYTSASEAVYNLNIERDSDPIKITCLIK
ncbi:hypothetical protein HLH17_02025 [Acinetobacter sp. ANC 5380]|uniref:Uncharacterized protein n=1 Tax=Acinetobacter terrae TaxID=2731247 RepID=A0A7Y2RDN2_9GAMM|nr:hypothetical protein [Acinetobacter terrae]NNH76481.1 hypothetical protein [Acinetobacter terrae]